jgi:DNA-binding MarR family transcriptional regulator
MTSPTHAEALIEAIVMSYHRLTLAAEQLHERSGLTTGMRSVLLTLDRTGPLSSSQLAAARVVSRQFMQKLTSSMVDDGWLSREVSPNDRRVIILKMTAKAKRAVTRVKRLERPLLEQLEKRLGRVELVRAVDVLDQLCGLVSDAKIGASH